MKWLDYCIRWQGYQPNKIHKPVFTPQHKLYNRQLIYYLCQESLMPRYRETLISSNEMLEFKLL